MLFLRDPDAVGDIPMDLALRRMAIGDIRPVEEDPPQDSSQALQDSSQSSPVIVQLQEQTPQNDAAQGLTSDAPGSPVLPVFLTLQFLLLQPLLMSAPVLHKTNLNLMTMMVHKTQVMKEMIKFLSGRPNKKLLPDVLEKRKGTLSLVNTHWIRFLEMSTAE